jgi:PAS domain S-box-containing protein
MVLEGRRVIYSNQGFLEAIKKPSEQVVGRLLKEVMPPPVNNGIEDLLSQMDENRGQIITGSVEWSDDMLGEGHLAIRGETRNGYIYLSVHRPWGEGTESEEKLMEVEDKLAALLGLAANAGMGVGVFEVSEEGNLLPRSFNEHVISIFNRSEEDMVGKDPAEWMHPDDRPKMEKMMMELMETGSNSLPIQLRAIDSNGEVIHIQVSNTMLSPPNEHLGISFIQDLTPMREALDQHNRMALAIERIEESVTLADATGRVFYVNASALRRSGYTMEEVIGQPITMFISSEGKEDFVNQRMMEFLKRGWWKGDALATSKDGTRYPVEIIGSAVRDDKGELSMIVVVSRRTVERQRHEAQLMMAKSNTQRLREHLEQRLFPHLESSIEALGATQSDDGEDIAAVAENLRETVKEARETMMGLSSPEAAEVLGPIRLGKVLSERIPGMMAKNTDSGGQLSVSIEGTEPERLIMANDMLPDLIMGIIEVLTEMAEYQHPKFKIVLGSMVGSGVPGTPPEEVEEGNDHEFATIEITCPGLSLGDDLRSILTRQEYQTRGPLQPEESLAMETSRLLLFIYKGVIISQKGSRGRDETVSILLPMD